VQTVPTRVCCATLNERLLPKEQRRERNVTLERFTHTLNERLLPKEQRLDKAQDTAIGALALNERLLPKEQRLARPVLHIPCSTSPSMKGCSRKSSDPVADLDKWALDNALNERLLPKEQRP